MLLVPRRADGGVGGRRRRTVGWPTDGSRLSDAGGEGSPTLSASAACVRHGGDEAAGRGAIKGKLRRTPTWRAKCRISGSGKTLEVRTLGCARRSPLPNHALSLTAISRPSSTNLQHKRHEIYTGLGHRCGVIPYSSVVWWIASWAEDEQYKGKNSLLRRGVLVLGGCEDDLNLISPTVVASSIYRGLGPLPKY